MTKLEGTTAMHRTVLRNWARLAAVALLVTGMLLRLAMPAQIEAAPASGAASARIAPAALTCDDDDDNDCVDDDDDDCDDDGDDDCDDEWEGIVISLPGELTGIWSVRIEDGSTLTVTTSLATVFDPPLRSAYAVGTWVEIDGVRQVDGTVVATSLRVDDFEVGEIVVRVADPTITATLAISYELTLKSTLLASANIYLFSTDDDDELDLATRIGAEPGVIWAELNYVNSVPEGEGYKTWGWGGAEEPGVYTNQGAFAQIGLSGPARHFDGAGVTVAILDTGVYAAHATLQPRLLLPSLDVIGDDLDPGEMGPGLAWGHGTHIAGIVAAMAPQAKILPVRVLDVNGRGNTFLLAYAIEWAVAQGAKVINLSLGTDANSSILADAVAEALAQGVVIVAAAGNRSDGVLSYPAAYPGVLGVTAVDAQNRKATFANYGAGWVDLAAPGVGIMSTMIEEFGPGFATWSGTSMATGFVTGAAALLAGQELTRSSVNAEIAQRLVETGRPIDDLNPNYQGTVGRLLDVSRALGVPVQWAQALWLPSLRH